MSVTATTFNLEPYTLDVPTRLKLLKKYNLNIVSEWKYTATVTGDASGGNIIFPVDLGSFNNDLFYCISKIFIYDPTNSVSHIRIESDRWRNFYNPSISNIPLVLMEFDSNFRGIAQTDQIKKVIYLGQPRRADADSGKLDVYISTNTEAYVYSCVIQGFALKEPLPLSSITDLFI